MFDLADYYSMNSVMLDEHFRSLPPIINFSKHEFYNDRIRVMRKDRPDEKVLELVEVFDGKVETKKDFLVQAGSFTAGRLFTLVVEDLLIFIFIN